MEDSEIKKMYDEFVVEYDILPYKHVSETLESLSRNAASQMKVYFSDRSDTTKVEALKQFNFMQSEYFTRVAAAAHVMDDTKTEELYLNLAYLLNQSID